MIGGKEILVPKHYPKDAYTRLESHKRFVFGWALFSALAAPGLGAVWRVFFLPTPPPPKVASLGVLRCPVFSRGVPCVVVCCLWCCAVLCCCAHLLLSCVVVCCAICFGAVRCLCAPCHVVHFCAVGCRCGLHCAAFSAPPPPRCRCVALGVLRRMSCRIVPCGVTLHPGETVHKCASLDGKHPWH